MAPTTIRDVVKVIIAGSRPPKNSPQIVYQRYESFVKNTLDEICKGVSIDAVISGMCYGPDMYAVEWARSKYITVDECYADWKVLEKRAGYVRNTEMAEEHDATHLIAFWDGVSKGTGHMIDIAKANKIKTKIVRVNFSLFANQE